MSRFWRCVLFAMWTALLIIQFGPISSADQGSSGVVQDALAVIALFGEVAVIVGNGDDSTTAIRLGAQASVESVPGAVSR